jgi:oxygen-dependent protoporphyrinogen oxidase
MASAVDRRGAAEPPDVERGEPRSVIVIGAGISGLVAAWELKRRGVPVTVYEAGPHAGGAIGTSLADGFLAERGPNAFVASGPTEALITRLGLQPDVVEMLPGANRRYVVRGGRLLPFPTTPPALLGTSLFSVRAKLRVLLEPLVRRAPPEAEESVASFVRRRLGPEVLDYAVNPFVAGIFTGDPERLSMAHAFPRVHEFERTHGSLSKGLVRSLRRTRRPASRGRGDAGAVEAAAFGDAGAHAAPGPAVGGARLISFRDGMQVLTDTLADALGNALKLSTPARLLHRGEARWIVESGPDGAVRARAVDAVVLATPAHSLAAMELPAAVRRHALPIEQVTHPPVSLLTLGFRREDVAHPLDAVGVLVPAVERRQVLGVSFVSSIFPERAPAGHVALTVFVGGARQPDLARLPTDALVRTIRGDLRDLLGIRGEPVFTTHVYWSRGIPQYEIGHGRVQDAAGDTEAANPGLYLVGNYRHGVSVGDCIASGQQAADRVAAYLTRTN